MSRVILNLLQWLSVNYNPLDFSSDLFGLPLTFNVFCQLLFSGFRMFYCTNCFVFAAVRLPLHHAASELVEIVLPVIVLVSLSTTKLLLLMFRSTQCRIYIFFGVERSAVDIYQTPGTSSPSDSLWSDLGDAFR